MKHFKSMVGIDTEYRDAAVSITNNSSDHIWLMVSKQYELLNNIITTKQLELDIETLMEKTVLALIDELNEVYAWFHPSGIVTNPGMDVPQNVKILEIRYEYVDALHFVIQLILLGTMKELGIKPGEYHYEVVETAVNVIKGKRIGSVDYRFYSVEEMMFKVSAILENLKWKHWKTYKEDPFDFLYFIETCVELFDMLVYSHYLVKHGVFPDDMKKDWPLRDITIEYVIKNIENFDRQARGY